MAKLQELRAKKLRSDQLSAEEAVLDDLFFDLYKGRGRVYRMNFVRGVFFGLGSVLGGTIFIAAGVAVLTWISHVAPGELSGFFQWIVDTISKK